MTPEEIYNYKTYTKLFIDFKFKSGDLKWNYVTNTDFHTTRTLLISPAILIFHSTVDPR
jgi:hypothetical protein